MTAPTPRIRVGLIGCGKISDAYFTGLRRYAVLEVTACADLDFPRAQAKAAAQGVRAATVDDLLAAPDVDLVVNLTIPAAHAAVNRSILEAGRHAYCEKPFALNTRDGRAVLDLARARGLLIGCAPDTFLGGGQQTARDAVDRGLIGRPLTALAFMLSRGHETWHPSPEFYYQPGGGPMFDMGPYYLTALVNLLGPARSVVSANSRAFAERTITSQPLAGQVIAVDVDTHYSTTVEFASGALATLLMSFDSPRGPALPRMVVYGSEGALEIPDPNTFDGANVLFRYPGGEASPHVSQHTNDRARGSGVADLAYSILRPGRAFRPSGELAMHVLEIMEAADRASAEGRRIQLTTTCAQPTALPAGLPPDLLDA